MRTLLPLLVVACAPVLPAGDGSSTVRFSLGGPLDWGDVPMPSDLYRDAEGRVALGALPNPLDGTALFDALRETLVVRGACSTCATYAYIDGGLDPDSMREGVALVDLVSGVRVPLQLQFDARSSLLAARPTRGHVLRPATPHALVLTDALRAPDGTPVGPSPTFQGLVHTHDPRVAPTLAALDRWGFERDAVVGLASFTTGTPVTLLHGVREQVEASAPAVVVVDDVFRGEDLDALLGEPAEDRPGVDVPPLGEGTRSVRHDTTAVVVAGRLTAPRFVQGQGTDVGALMRDDDGRPVSLVDDEVPFVLIVPEGAHHEQLPVAVVHHGFGSSRTIAFVLADTLGAHGIAVLAIDGFQHGARAASASDTRNAMRDLDGPDGFAESVALDVSGRMFGLLGTEPDQAFAASLPLAAFTQLAADALSTIRWARDGDLSALQAVPELADLSFDPDRIAFVGNSMGAVVGVSVVAASPDVSAAVLNVLPGSIIDTLAESGEFRPLTESVLLGAVGVAADFDEVDRALTLDPTVDLYRWALEPIDPLALAPELAGRSLLVQLAGHDEVAAPGPSESVAAAAGLAGVGTFMLADVPAADLPVRAAVTRFDGAMHGMLEVAAQVSAYEDPLDVPLVERPETVVLDNPIEDVHDQLASFLAAWVEGGDGRLD